MQTIFSHQNQINSLIGNKVKIINCFLSGREGIVIDQFGASGVQVLINNYIMPLSFDLHEIELTFKPKNK